jgi:hypothetical protein
VGETNLVVTSMNAHDLFAKKLLRPLQVPTASYDRMETRRVVERAEALDRAYADLTACIAIGRRDSMSVWRLEFAKLLNIPADIVDKGLFFDSCEIIPIGLKNIAVRDKLHFKCYSQTSL